MIEATYRQDRALWLTDNVVCGYLADRIRQDPAYPYAHAIRSDYSWFRVRFLIQLNDANAPIPLYLERLVVPFSDW